MHSCNITRLLKTAPPNECTNTAEKTSHCGKYKLKVGVSWAKVVDDRAPDKPTIVNGKVSSSACPSTKTRHPSLK